MLGVFVPAFAFPSVRGTAAFWGVLVGETVVVLFALLTRISYLWYNLIGCAATVFVGVAISWLTARGSSGLKHREPAGARNHP